MKYNYKSLFATKNEKFVAIMGPDYFSSILTEDDFSKPAIVISDKRIYQFGKVYELGLLGLIGGRRVNTGKKIVNLEDVTGTTTRELSKPLLGYSVILLGLLFALLGILSDVRQSTMIMLGLALLTVTGGVLLIIRRKQNCLIVEYAGGTMILPVEFVTQTELDLFQGIISLEKDRAKEGFHDFKVCPYCAEKIQAQAKICRFCEREQEVVPVD
ncbi:MAG TPA: hypothetical protein VLR49_02400 [Ferruginibacter sp.]|nr:hypothetical protein [Ferruginibacter sp.]